MRAASTLPPAPAHPFIRRAVRVRGHIRRSAVHVAASVLLCAWVSGSPRYALADEGETSDIAVKDRRYELAGFPIVAGSTDIGVQFGGAATLTRFWDRQFPYDWNLDMLLTASVKDDQNGIRIVQQAYVLRLDNPGLLSGRLRLDTRGSFQRTINAGYYGLGNAAVADLTPPPGKANIGQRYQYQQDEGRVRAIARLHTGTPFDVAFGANLRYEAPTVYADSQLGQDLASHNPDGNPVTYGGSAMGLAGLTVGAMYDTRDSEFVTRQGIFYQVGVGPTLGTAEGVAFGEASVVLAHFAPLPGPFVFASRFVASFQFGRIPFYDLAQGGNFEPQYLLGSENGVRGVPFGRYAGPIKIMTNLEIRATPFPRFKLLGQRLRIGTSTFFDAGRTWNEYKVISAADGDTLGLKYGVGGGIFLQWGEAAIFRIEAAFSPDAESENQNLPVGIYVSDGLMF
ncbi:MAG: BamA/TamA family outer membrane protein [Polyangiaceae bacterium]